MKSKFKVFFTLIIAILLSFSLNHSKTITTSNKTYFVNNILEDAYIDDYSYDGSSSDNNDYSYDGLSSDNNVDNQLTNNFKKVVNGNDIIIQDDASLLSSGEKERLLENMEKISEYGNVIFKTINNNVTSTSYYAEKFYHQNYSSGTSGIMFLIDMDNREIYIYSDGTIYKIITKSKALVITDNVYSYASRGDYYGCANEAFDEIYSLLSGNKIMEPMRYITNAILSLVIAALIGFLLSITNASIKSTNSSDIVKLLNKKIDVVGDFTIIQVGQRRVYSPVSDSSSGGSSGGHSSGGGGGFSGGGSSGGGGGHRF